MSKLVVSIEEIKSEVLHVLKPESIELKSRKHFVCLLWFSINITNVIL